MSTIFACILGLAAQIGMIGGPQPGHPDEVVIQTVMPESAVPAEAQPTPEQPIPDHPVIQPEPSSN
jgi:hypothetical protein